jgi:hypothetical protein
MNIKSPSKDKTIYNKICVVCVYITLLCVIMDTFVHRQDLVEAMKKLRIVLAMLLVAWIYFSLRYATL